MDHNWRTLEPYDWRYSAAITGLVRYFKFFEDKASEWEIDRESLKYNPESINEHDYLVFAEAQYPEDMHHLLIEEMLLQKEFDDNTIKKVNEKLSANTILKKVFKGKKFDGTNAGQIQHLLDDNRDEIIKETFRHKNNLYQNFCNKNQLFQEPKKCCRLLGYYVDMPKKGKALTYNFKPANFTGIDDDVFDFIPFAFQGEREVFFINDNIELKNLDKTNDLLKDKIAEERQRVKNEGKTVDARQIFFKLLAEMNNFIRSDIEVIVKDVRKPYFETLYLRKESLNVLNGLKQGAHKNDPYQCFCFRIKVTDKYWIDVFKDVTEAILNLTLLDGLLDYLLKNRKERDYTYVISQLIKLNILIKEDKELKQKTKRAYACAKTIIGKKAGAGYKVPDNKLNSYIQKLTSALTFEDYDRFNNVLLNLANYSDESVDFAYDLFEDFEKNKELAYTFVNALHRVQKEF